ncbi:MULTISPECIES: toprim domain-containing protein [Chryseobacterium]|uniref:toprim domain-containing protein n=1 Tax=Chryseobacterium TaxID=59732 RepID=UPI0023583155|nr:MULTISPECIES: toprim domain-containing protein [Chryseobacterium]MDC8102712.1 toprim domain-containing protein [Chryseobacterium rhizosphaerae]
MNCEEIKKNIGIRTVLESFNLFPVKENLRTAFYFALDREEKIPSLSVDFIKNKAFDFGTGRSYDVISIVQAINKCSISDALKYLGKLDFSYERTEKNSKEGWQTRPYEISKTHEITHPALVRYLKERKVYEQSHLVKEIHFRLKLKNYFAVGFFNDSGGIEIRNQYFKICLGDKDVTLVKNGSNEIAVFEGFFDFLTYRNIENKQDCPSDYLVLNSTAMLYKIEKKLSEYSKISLFLDNDPNGRQTVKKMMMKYENAEDCSLIYKGFKDLNEWFCQRK